MSMSFVSPFHHAYSTVPCSRPWAHIWSTSFGVILCGATVTIILLWNLNKSDATMLIAESSKVLHHTANPSLTAQTPIETNHMRWHHATAASVRHFPHHVSTSIPKQPCGSSWMIFSITHLLYPAIITAAMILVCKFVSLWRLASTRRAPISLAAYAGRHYSLPSYSICPPFSQQKSTSLVHCSKRRDSIDAEKSTNLNNMEELLQLRGSISEYLRRVAVKSPLVFPWSVTYAIRKLNEEEIAFIESLAKISPEDAELYGRIRDLRKSDRQKVLEETMHLFVDFSFQAISVEMLTSQYLASSDRIEAIMDWSLSKIFSSDAVEVIEGRMPGLLGMLNINAQGRQSPLFPLMSCKYHVAQVYASSALFGYFLRQADKRFALAKSAGLVPPVLTFDETVALLSELYNSVDDNTTDLDKAVPPRLSQKPRGRTVTLQEHMETLQPEITMQMMRMVSQEAVHALQNRIKDLIGDVDMLQQQLTKVLQESNQQQDIGMLGRLRRAIEQGKVEVLSLTSTDQHRLVMEAIAYGAFLRDIEDEIQALQQCPLLTPNDWNSGTGEMSDGDGYGDGGGGGGGGGGGDGGPESIPPGPVGPAAVAD